MYKNDKVYRLLYNLGLEDNEIQEICKVNIYLSKVLASDVLQLLEYLENQGLNVEEIMEVSIKNPWVLTENFQRLRWLEKVYSSIGIDGEKYKELIVKYPISISLNPVDVENKIKELEMEGMTKEEIQEKFFMEFDNYFEL